MPVAILSSRSLNGMMAPEVRVEAHLAGGLPACNLVGRPETEVKEARDRVRAALQNSRFEFPARRITVNLAPADLPKESGRFDLPIALAILVASGQLPGNRLTDYEFAGELALTGELRPIRGALAMTLAARDQGKTLILPLESAREAALVEGAKILGANHLLEVCAHLLGQGELPLPVPDDSIAGPSYPDLSEIKGQRAAKRALEVAATGGHSILIS